MEKLELSAPAKINWGLDIRGRRPDGYHLLRSLMQTVSLADTVTLQRSGADDCRCPGLPAAGNLAFRAWLLLKQRCGIRDHLLISIEKQIPPGAGLAGGSSDAAAVLRGANELFGLGLSLEELCAIGLELGADLPFCLYGGLALAEGVGERIRVLPPARSWPLLLVNPGFPVSTPAVYAAYDALGEAPHPDIDGLWAALAGGDGKRLLCASGNALEVAACSLHPELAELKQALTEQGLHPLLSGSGGTFFVIAEEEEEARDLAESWQKRIPWARAARTIT